MLQSAEEALRRRGPDSYSCMMVPVADDCRAWLQACVLWTQGNSMMPQPAINSSGGILLWNGDVFGGRLAQRGSLSDTEVLSTELIRSSFLHVMCAVRGPYSVVYWEPGARRLWFGRDRLGRHSLLLWRGSCGGKAFAVSSVTSKTLPDAIEVPAIGLFSARFADGDFGSMCLYPWSDIMQEQLMLFEQKFGSDCRISEDRLPSPIVVPALVSMAKEPAEDELLAATLAATGLLPMQVATTLLQDVAVAARVDAFLAVLRSAVQTRIFAQPSLCKRCRHSAALYDSRGTCGHARTAVLFSGGLDSAMLARLAHEYVPGSDPIDLLNVAFEKYKPPDRAQCRKQRRAVEQTTADVFDVPDRRTGRETLRELRKCFPSRQWNFVQINIDATELDTERNGRIRHLIHPLCSVLDDSLGCALWFASRGAGVLEQPDGQCIGYTSPATIVLGGMGADEQLGGYARHRVVLHRGGWPGLSSELRLELERISSRNLGRDDRVTADHGRQGRYPYLEEDVVSFLASLPPWHRCCPVPALPPGLGDKLLLRLAALKLGLSTAAFLPKRAFQFGSRIANSKEKATNVSHRL